MNPSRLTRRLLAGAAGLLVGAAGALAVAAPASAHHTVVKGTPECVTETGEWLVTWTVTSRRTPPDVTQFRLTGARHQPAGTELTGLPLEVDQSIDQPFTGQQRLPGDATSATLTVTAKWDNGNDSTDHGEVRFAGTCDQQPPDEQSPPDELGEWDFDCETLSITLTNPAEQDLPLTFAPSAGDPVEVTVAGGETATVELPASEGLSVEVLRDGEPVELDEPIGITSDEWSELECDQDDGAGGSLPETGASTGLIAAGALALLVLGGGLYLVARRRRVSFTA